jgi:hypothetical protein
MSIAQENLPTALIDIGRKLAFGKLGALHSHILDY